MAPSGVCDKEACATKQPTECILFIEVTNLSIQRFAWEAQLVFYRGILLYEWCEEGDIGSTAAPT